MSAYLYSSTTTTSLLNVSPATPRFNSAPPANQPPKLFNSGAKYNWVKYFNLGVQCNAISKPEFSDDFQSDLPVINCHEVLEANTKTKNLKLSSSNKIQECVDSIRAMFGSMDDGEISVSAYDTAWVALVEDINGSGIPQFPSSLQWIANNQLSDGSWGDNQIFLAHDRILNTLACVVALKSWNIHHEKMEKGMSFIKENMHRLQDESIQHMLVGFEVAFPSLIEIAQRLDIEVPVDLPVLQEIYAQRNVKLTRIPKDLMHEVPTPLLFSLEGMPEPDWKKLLKLQCLDGSFLFSPSSTACALMHTKDDNCLRYLSKAVQKFNGGDVFRNFEKNGEFFCIAGQSNQAVTGMFNLFRASQVLFPGEEVLEDAKKFSFEFLREKQVNNQILDKWIISKDLAGEVGYALDMPWYASLPRVETSFYLEQYGGQDDVWIGKTLYRMPCVNNNIYLELAKLDFAKCQSIHQLEWSHMKEWYAKYRLGEFGMSKRSLLLSYYLASSSLFDPEMSTGRFAWAKTATLVETIRTYFRSHQNSIEQRKAFVDEFKKTSENLNYLNYGSCKSRHELIGTLLGTLKQISLDALVAHSIDIHHHLRHAWEMWLLTWQKEGDVDQGEAELLVRTINICAGRWLSENLLSDPQYERLFNLTNGVCHQLRLFQYHKLHDEDSCKTYKNGITTMTIESSMQELVQQVFCSSSDGLDRELKQTFFMVARTFYYTAYCNPSTIDDHVVKVIFAGERVL